MSWRLKPSILLKTTLELLSLRSSPARLPASHGLLALAAALFLGVGGWIYAQLGLNPLRALLDLGILSMLLFALLHWRDLDERLIQTLSAFLICGSVTSLVAAPALTSVEPGGTLSMGASYLIVAVMLWDLLVSAHLLRCALSLPMLAGVVLAVAVTFISVSVGDFLLTLFDGDTVGAGGTRQ